MENIKKNHIVIKDKDSTIGFNKKYYKLDVEKEQNVIIRLFDNKIVYIISES